MNIELPVLPEDPRYPYTRPTKEEREWVQSFPLSDLGVSLIVSLRAELEPYDRFVIGLGAVHGVDFNEIEEVPVRSLVDERISDNLFGDGTIDDEGRQQLERYAQYFEAEAAYIREKIAAAPQRGGGNGEAPDQA